MNHELKQVLITSLLGTAGAMWVVGGFVIVLELFGEHWLLGWGSLFVWVWICWAGALYFNVKRFFS